MADGAPKSVVVPYVLPFHKRCAVGILCACARLFFATWRLRWLPATPSAKKATGASPVIYCIWHNRLAMAVASYNKENRQLWPVKGVAAVVSASRDGAFLAAILEQFRMQPIRGSSSRRGGQALLEATTWLEKGYTVVITPDGPRGPCYKIQEGIMSLAQLTGRPIVPLGINGHPHFKARSWDKFQLPVPFANCRVLYGEPIFVPRDADDVERKRIRAELERVMLETNPP
ncbi:MAG: hypothetical protein JWO95_102 [Verrucomicrobiales bacterium]|nr:hypothetical protein [Verrucomicrobiales bacterium]